MILNDEDLVKLKKAAISAAKAAAEMISLSDLKGLSVKNKDVGESKASQVFTEIDIKSQEIILEKLIPTIKEYDLGLLTEEAVDDKSRLEKDYFWSIDPLDGTLAFIEGKAGYSISIALIRKDGIGIIGVVYDPVNKNLYHTIKGKGVFKNNSPWILEENNRKDKNFTFVMDRSFLKHKDYVYVAAFIKEYSKEINCNEIKVISFAGAVMNAIWVLENSPAIYIKLPKEADGGGSLWDYGASSVIFEEIGAHVSDIFNEGLDLNRKDSVFMNHRGVFYASDRILAKAIYKKLILNLRKKML